MISEYLLGTHQTISKKNNPLVPKYGRKIRDIGKMINLGKDLTIFIHFYLLFSN